VSDSPSPSPIRASVLGDRGVFIWQKALHVAGTDLPETVRYSLIVLALYMNPDGTSGRPGYKRFILARGKSERTLRSHVDQAIAAGWLECVQRGGRNGDGTTRASVWVATFPPEVFFRLNDILMPAWGDSGLPQPATSGLPVEEPADTPSQPATPGLPVEDVSTGNLAASTGNRDASTGSPALPPTDHFHRADTPISQSVQRAEANALLYRLYGLTEDQAAAIIEEAHRRAAGPIRNLARYIQEMADQGDLTNLVEAVQRTAPQPFTVGDDPLEAEQEGFPSPGNSTRPPLCPRHPGGPEDPLPIGDSRCLLCNDLRRKAESSASGGAPTGLRAQLEQIQLRARDRQTKHQPAADLPRIALSGEAFDRQEADVQRLTGVAPIPGTEPASNQETA